MNQIPHDFESEREALTKKVFCVVAHDLLSPLAVIIGSLGTLTHMSKTLSHTQKDMLIETALAEAKKLEIFVADALSKAKSNV